MAKDLPVVEESVDEIVLLQIEGHTYNRVLFFKNGKLLTSRIFDEEFMLWVEGDEFVVIWDDFSIAHRIVRTKTFGTMYLDFDPTLAGRRGPWWKMGRNMRNLKKP